MNTRCDAAFTSTSALARDGATIATQLECSVVGGDSKVKVPGGRVQPPYCRLRLGGALPVAGLEQRSVGVLERLDSRTIGHCKRQSLRQHQPRPFG